MGGFNDMHQEVKHEGPRRVKARRRISFAPEEALAALVYIKRIARDIRSEYSRITRMRDMYGVDAFTEDQRADYNDMLDQLGGYVDELEAMGLHMWDFGACVVRFPARHQGQRAFIIWRHDAPDNLTWAYEHDHADERPIETFGDGKEDEQ